MPIDSLKDAAARYARDGFLSPVDIISAKEAAQHRARMETAEAEIGPLHYRPKVHTILFSPLALATAPRTLDLVEALIGPDILLYNVTYVVKEAGTREHVSWHQDLTYWGLDGEDQVSVWLALSPATAESGCMRMVPGSHRQGRREHRLTDDENNVLYQGQTVSGVAEADAVDCALQPGQASFHHGWTLHASMPNAGQDRRIGLNVQYLNPRMRQTKHDRDSAILVRGKDPYGHFGTDVAAEADLDPAALERHKVLERLYYETTGSE